MRSTLRCKGVTYIILVHRFCRELSDRVRVNGDRDLFASGIVAGAFSKVLPREKLLSRLVSNMHMTK